MEMQVQGLRVLLGFDVLPRPAWLDLCFRAEEWSSEKVLCKVNSSECVPQHLNWRPWSSAFKVLDSHTHPYRIHPQHTCLYSLGLATCWATIGRRAHFSKYNFGVIARHFFGLVRWNHCEIQLQSGSWWGFSHTVFQHPALHYGTFPTTSVPSSPLPPPFSPVCMGDTFFLMSRHFF